MAYKFYIQKEGAASPMDLTSRFRGLHYQYCKGLETVGKPKNVYSEDYPETDGPRLFIPDEIKREATSIELSLVFDNRDVYNNFFNDVFSDGKPFYYWDTARHKKVRCVLLEAVEPSMDRIIGMSVLVAQFKLTNLWGVAKKCNDKGQII